MMETHEYCTSTPDGQRCYSHPRRGFYNGTIIETVFFFTVPLSWVALTILYLMRRLLRRLTKQEGNVSSSSTPTPDRHSKGRKLMEVSVLSLYILFWIFMILGHLTEHDRMVKRTEIVNRTETGKNYCPTIHTEQYDDAADKEYSCRLDQYSDTEKICGTTEQVTMRKGNVENVFRRKIPNYEASTLKGIAVYRCPLTAPFASSSFSVRSYLRRQFLPMDYHAFVVIETSDGMFWALEKLREGIFVSWGRSRDSVLFYFDQNPRAEPVRDLLVRDKSIAPVSQLVRRLKKVLESGDSYDLVGKNCQHFAKEIFDKFASEEIWELSTLTDLTSPLRLLSELGPPPPLVFLIVFLLYEIFLLFKESSKEDIVNPSYHYRYVVIAVVMIPGVLLPFIDRERFLTLGHMISWILVGVALPIETLLYGTLATLRRRAKQYDEMTKSNRFTIFGMFTRICWLVPCYTAVYIFAHNSIFLSLPLDITLTYGHYLKRYVPSAVLSQILDILSIICMRFDDGLIFMLSYTQTITYFYYPFTLHPPNV